MEETFCSYGQALGLSRIGFDWSCERAYFDRPWNHEHKLVYMTDANNQACAYDGTDVYPAPSLQIAARWLREAKGMDIFVLPAYKDERRVQGYDWNIYDDMGDNPVARGCLPFVRTYEFALSDAISCALNLLLTEDEHDIQQENP